MPSLKQPVLLRDKAMAVLDAFSYEFCRQCHTEQSLDKLRQGIAFIKTKIGPCMPRNLAVVFYNTLLRRCSSLGDLPDLPHTRFLRIVLEVAMDEKLMGLRCTFEILASLNPEDFHRIQGFSELELNKLIEPYSLENLHLGNLTKFEYRRYCTDLDLVIIGHYCRKLIYIDVSHSTKVTDTGLRALGLCSNLRSVSVANCRGVSETGLKNMLTVNVRLSEVFGWVNSDYPGFDYFLDPDWESDISVHPSIESFAITQDEICDRYTRFLVTKFPNLTSIGLNGKLTGDVCILKSLRRLSKIDFSCDSVQTSDKIESLLKFIGAQIKHLVIEVTQSPDLNLIFELCKNLEYLRLDISDRADHEVMLIVPPFQKLKDLICLGDLVCFHGEEEKIHKLKFGQMLKLENLEINGFTMSRSELESMTLDHTNFPSLKIIKKSGFCGRNDFVYLSDLARTCNLDLELHDVEPYYC